MEDFIKKAFEKATKDAKNLQDTFDALYEEFDEVSTMILDIVADKIGDKGVMRLYKEVISDDELLTYVQTLCFSFYAAGRIGNEKKEI